jgi:NADPH:quinone reductase-like Zn-dependent oxidoreductase
MKAMVYTRFGSPEMLQLRDVARPNPGDDEVLIRVHASSINAWDWDLLGGRPFLTRLAGGGIRAPRHTILGADVAGRVEAVGRGVDGFQPGDEVYGDLSGSGFGGFAEYMCAPERVLARKPAALSFEQAAAIPQAGVLALQALRKGQVREGQRVLIVGAGGGAGTFAVRMAASSGADVTGVDRGDKLDMLHAIGASRVIDYTLEDFATTGQQYDLIVDMVMRRSVFDYRRALATNGTLVVVGGATGRLVQLVSLGPVISRLSGKRLGLLVHRPNREDLDEVGALAVSDQAPPMIDRTYPLQDLAAAFRYFGDGNAKGKVVIAVSAA